MPGFYNPMSPRPDYAGGFQDIMSNIMQMLMIKKMFPGGGGQASLGQTAAPGGMMGGQGQSIASRAPGSMPDQPYSPQMGGGMGGPPMGGPMQGGPGPMPGGPAAQGSPNIMALLQMLGPLLQMQQQKRPY